LLIGADQDPSAFAGAARRLERLAEGLAATTEPAGAAVAMEAAPREPEPISGSAGVSAISAAVEAPLARLEQLVANGSDHSVQRTTDYAPA
jgi:hypothetical protein